MVRVFLCLVLFGCGAYALAEEQGAATPAECEADVGRERFYALNYDLRAALQKHDDGEIVRLAEEYLALAPRFKGDWNYGNAIHDANVALGGVAWRKKDPKRAAKYLLKAGATPGSPQLNSFGPDLSLANALLTAGDRKNVVAYLRAIGSFWESGRDALPGVIAQVEKGEVKVLRPEQFWAPVQEGQVPPLSAADKCLLGYELTRQGHGDDAMELLSDCIASSDASAADRKRAYLARAWTNKKRGKISEAVADQESAFTLGAPTYAELINYGLYLREAGRAADSLEPLHKAEEMEAATGKVSMMTEYHLGWSYQAAGRNEEAVAAFTKGIPAQPDYAFVYYMRGLSLEALGRKAEARQDFETVNRVLTAAGKRTGSDAELEPLRRKLAEYGLK